MLVLIQITNALNLSLDVRGTVFDELVARNLAN